VIGVVRKLALVAAVSPALVAFAPQAFGAQLGLGRQPLASPRGEITGTISFNVRWASAGFTLGACRDFKVVAQSGRLGTSSGRMRASLYRKTVDCAYTISRLPTGRYTVTPQGYAAGYAFGPRNAHFSPAQRTVTLTNRNGAVRTRANFVYSAGSIVERTAPAP